MNFNDSMIEIEKVLSSTSKFKIKSAEEFDRCVAHIIQLINDAYTLYVSESFSTSAFISIAIIEEVGKTHMGLFIKEDKSTKMNKDPLRNHKRKQVVASNYTITMGSRLNKSIGEKELEEILQFVYTGELKSLREKYMYCDIDKSGLVTPCECIDKVFSRNLLLYAIEVFDDGLVGYSKYSMEMSKKTDELFEKLSKL